jgi:hypothetical protein
VVVTGDTNVAGGVGALAGSYQVVVSGADNTATGLHSAIVTGSGKFSIIEATCYVCSPYGVCCGVLCAQTISH